MDLKELYSEQEIKKFRLPRWEEIPSIDLYMDQVVSFLDEHLSIFIKTDNNDNTNIITKTMINNYVKHGALKPPVSKKYNREHIAYLFVIFILKQIYSLDEIKKLINLAIETSSTDQSYNRFCTELEKTIRTTFNGDNYINNDRLSKEQYIL
ncbi:MAG: DUF1836 domain-containing protein, partial [Clostridia bacterium]|nr:DUF1836 domain-containing protein [Clostridia bacterium]